MTGFPWCKNLWTFYLFCIIVFLGSIHVCCVNSFVLSVSSHTWVLQEQWRIQGRGWEAQAPLVLNQTEAQRAKKFFFWTTPQTPTHHHHPLISGSEWLGKGLDLPLRKLCCNWPTELLLIQTLTGLIESVCINGVSVLGGLNWEKM